MQSIPELIDALIKNPRVLAIVEFGKNHHSINFAEGDYDVLVILDRLDYQAKTIHFYVSNIPVDLNLRTLDYLRHLKILTGFEQAFAKGRIIYDPTGEVTRIIHHLQQDQSPARPDSLTENDVIRIRHWHKHVLDKIEGRQNSASTFCHFLLNTNIFWLIENYCRIRKLPDEGPTRIFEYLRQQEPGIYDDIQKFYKVSDLSEKIELTQRLTEMILQPIGGPWRDDEILAFGDGNSSGLQEQGQEIFNELFSGREKSG